MAWERARGDEEEEQRLLDLQEAYDARYESISRTPAPVPSVEELADEAARSERSGWLRSALRTEMSAARSMTYSRRAGRIRCISWSASA